ncbi:AraC family transcriptional regulator [Streptomyces sp. AD681]|uniref:AraC family transcriptional regulator n=1 Tax=Streptomyces sp. AD681 TaxID=3019069 RepID=UPI0022F163FC|nr:AraC family transcriptional regulator [Streptomyces sp. AD681]MDA5144079.1 AraC family transcriptional regulator [Streptomyces sp. AD681]
MKSRKVYASPRRDGVVGSGDPIVDVLRLLHTQAVVPARVHAASPWAVRFDPYEHVKLGVVLAGECWMVTDACEPVSLRQGDFFLLNNPPAYTLTSAPDVAPSRVMAFRESEDDGEVRIGLEADEDTYVCCIDFVFEEANASVLFDVLPPVVLVRAGDPRGALLANLSALTVAEMESAGVGRSLVLEHLAQLILVHMLRVHADETERPVGWLGALVEDGIGAALRAMHGDVSRRWTLDELAAISHMSRSAFSAAFKAKVGTAPLTYLIEWRMSLARDALRRNTRSISELAAATGYESESAFSTAFRRVVGSSPRYFRDEAQQQAGVT